MREFLDQLGNGAGTPSKPRFVGGLAVVADSEGEGLAEAPPKAYLAGEKPPPAGGLTIPLEMDPEGGQNRPFEVATRPL